MLFKLLTWGVIGYFAYHIFWKGRKRIDKKINKEDYDIIDIDYEEVE